MKKLIVILAIAVVSKISAQPTVTFPYLGTPKSITFIQGWERVDSGLLNALKDTILAPVRVGEQRFRQADSTLYIATSTVAAQKWHTTGGSGNLLFGVGDNLATANRGFDWNHFSNEWWNINTMFLHSGAQGGQARDFEIYTDSTITSVGVYNTSIGQQFDVISRLSASQQSTIVRAKNNTQSTTVELYTDSLILRQNNGIYKMMNLPSGVGTKAVRINPSTGFLTYADTTTGGASGLTVGTTTITSGTSTRVLYDNAGVLGEYSVTGTGTTAVLSTTPTFTTSIIDPLVIGGTGTTSTLTLQSTSGVGAAGADIIFKVGNNGATEAARILNSGNVGINTTAPGLKFEVKNPTNAQGAITGVVANNNIAISSPFTVGGNWNPGLIWYATDDNATIPKNGIWSETTNSGSILHFGSSGNYAAAPGKILTWDYGGSLNIGSSSVATARLQLPVGATGASAAPLKFTTASAALQTTPETGTVEVDSTQLYFSSGIGLDLKRRLIAMWGYTTTAVDYTALINDYQIEVTATGKTITLPTPAAGLAGKRITIVLTASGSSTVSAAANINGSGTYSLASQYKYVTVMWNGTTYIVVANN